MKILEKIPEVAEALKTFNLWGKDGRNSELLFSGTREECENELVNNHNEDHPDYDISSNKIVDDWGSPIEGIGYVKMADGKMIGYELD